MLVNFGHGKCPMCGDFGNVVEKDIFACSKCDVMFNAFHILFKSEPKEQDKFWN